MAFETKLFIIALVFVLPTIYFLAATLLLFRLLTNVSSDCLFYNTKPLVGKRMGRQKALFRNLGMAVSN
tara:strand:+ start:60 stop:266 length:207 start_codon:yes stop_codon:yes gene_type:complete